MMVRSYMMWLGIAMSGFVVAIDYTVIQLSSVIIMESFSDFQAQKHWLILAFSIPFAALMIVMGKIGDAYGERFIYGTSLWVLLFSSWVLPSASHFYVLLSLRFLQGVACSAILPCGMSALSKYGDARHRSRSYAWYSAIVGSGMALGPQLGVWIESLLGWSWLFYMNIPCCLMALGCLRYVPRSLPNHFIIDISGAFGLLLWLVMFSIWLSGELSMKQMCYGFLVLIAYLILWLIHNARHEYPLIPTEIMKNTNVRIGCIIKIASASLAWPMLYLSPQICGTFDKNMMITYVTLMTSMTVCVPFVIGFIKIYVWLVHLMFFCIITSCFILTTHHHTLLWGLAYILFGVGWGIGNAIALPMAVSRLAHHHGVVSGLLTTVLNMVGSCLIVICAFFAKHIDKISFGSIGFAHWHSAIFLGLTAFVGICWLVMIVWHYHQKP